MPSIRAAIVPVTPFQQNCALVWCEATKRAAVVDPGGDLDRIEQAIAATGVTVSAATLNGTVDPNGRPTTWWFEYGPSTSYGSRTTARNGG